MHHNHYFPFQILITSSFISEPEVKAAKYIKIEQFRRECLSGIENTDTDLRNEAFASCMVKKLGIIQENGKTDLVVLKDVLNTIISEEDTVNNLISLCLKQESLSSTFNKTAAELFKCLYKNYNI